MDCQNFRTGEAVILYPLIPYTEGTNLWQFVTLKLINCHALRYLFVEQRGQYLTE